MAQAGCTPCVVLAASYPHGARRLALPERSSGAGEEPAQAARSRCLLPQARWLRELCQQQGVDLSEGSGRGGTSDLQVCGALSLLPGAVWQNLAPASQRVEALREYFHKPRDAFSVQIAASAALLAPQPLRFMSRRPANIADHSCGLGSSITARVSRHIIFAAEEADEVDVGAACSSSIVGCTTVAAFLAHFGVRDEATSIPILLLPSPICALAIQRRWRELVLLARYCPPGWPWRTWPDADWIDREKGMHVQYDCSTTTLDFSRLKSIVANLRSWAPTLLQVAAEVEDEDGVELSLEGAVNYLDGLAHSLQTRTTSSKGHFHSDLVLKCVIAARKLRQRGKLSETMQEYMMPLLPDALRPMLQQLQADGIWRLASTSSMQRHQLSVCVALSLWRRAFISTQDGCRYLLADSSPQGGRDWFVVKYRFATTEQIVPLWRAMQSLIQSESASLAEDDSSGSEADKISDRDDEDGIPLLGHRHVARAHLFQQLAHSYKEYQCVPVSLALGLTSLPDKAAAVAFTCYMEAGAELKRFMASVVSVTTDMGTELGLTSFAGSSADCLLPAWLRRTMLQVDTDGVASGEEGLSGIQWGQKSAYTRFTCQIDVGSHICHCRLQLLSWIWFCACHYLPL